MTSEASSSLSQLELPSSSSAAIISLRLRESLEACSSSIELDHFIQSDEAVAPVTRLLLLLLESSNADLEQTLSSIESSEVALNDIYRFLSSPDSSQKVVEALSLELPKLVIRFAPLSAKCSETVREIIEHFVSVCNPREMLSVLCEALSSCSDDSEAPRCCSHILTGLSKVLLRIQRRHIEQVKVVLPAVLGVLNVLADEGNKDSLNDLFSAAVNIGFSIQEICQKLEGQRKVLCAILGLYALENIALISRARKSHIVESSSLIVAKFSQFLPFCGLSYFGLLTGDFDKINEICKDYDENLVASFSSAVYGASLTVLWGHISNEVIKVVGEHLDVVSEVREDRFRRWQAIGMFKHILISIDYPWIIKSHVIDVLLKMLDGIISEEHNDSDDDFSSFLPNLFSSLMAIERIIMGAPDPPLRKRAFIALRKVLSDIPCFQRFDMLKALIINSNSPSMVALLIDTVKEEVLVNNPKESWGKVQNKKQISKFWGSNSLDIVENVLRPPKGGPPLLPEHSEQVLSALNLFRFIIIIELTGKTNYTGVLSEDLLQKAYSEWFMPLRALVSGILAENETDGSERAGSIQCALSPLQSVLYRCIELVEHGLKGA